jgi:hypothetical protein
MVACALGALRWWQTAGGAAFYRLNAAPSDLPTQQS